MFLSSNEKYFWFVNTRDQDALGPPAPVPRANGPANFRYLPTNVRTRATGHRGVNIVLSKGEKNTDLGNDDGWSGTQTMWGRQGRYFKTYPPCRLHLTGESCPRPQGDDDIPRTCCPFHLGGGMTTRDCIGDDVYPDFPFFPFHLCLPGLLPTTFINRIDCQSGELGVDGDVGVLHVCYVGPPPPRPTPPRPPTTTTTTTTTKPKLRPYKGHLGGGGDDDIFDESPCLLSRPDLDPRPVDPLHRYNRFLHLPTDDPLRHNDKRVFGGTSPG